MVMQTKIIGVTASNRDLPYLTVANVMKLVTSLVLVMFIIASLGTPSPTADVIRSNTIRVTETAYAAAPPTKTVTPTTTPKPVVGTPAPAEPQVPVFDASNPATYPVCATDQVVWAQDGACHDKVAITQPDRKLSSAPAAQASNGASASCGDNEFAAFIYRKESGCRTNAINEIGACGIGQALPCSKMPCSLSDYDCQNDFFTKYAMKRYGSWQGAYNFWLSHKWW